MYWNFQHTKICFSDTYDSYHDFKKNCVWVVGHLASPRPVNFRHKSLINKDNNTSNLFAI